jgi:hypothetical protein
MVIPKEQDRKAKSNSETCSKHTKTSKNISAWWFGHPENMKVNWGGHHFQGGMDNVLFSSS